MYNLNLQNMKKIYFLAIAVLLSLTINAQTTIDISKVDAAYTTTVDGGLVIDVAKASSAIAAPKLSFENPFKGKTFDQAEISFDVYTYLDSVKVLGCLISVFDGTLGRMYFTNGSYLGYNATGGWFDANMIDYGIGKDFIGTKVWKNVKLQFSKTGFAVLVDNTKAFDQASTDVNIATDAAAPLTDYSNVISFLQNASILAIGAGSWWSDNTRGDGTYFDAQFSYMKNITFTTGATTASKKITLDTDRKVIGEEYFNITGRLISSDFNSLDRGIYIKRTRYDNGTFNSTKIVKAQ